MSGIEIRQTVIFAEWLERLCDRSAQRIITRRILRVAGGLIGDVRSLGGGVSELRVDYGPGYRLYFTRRGTEIVWLLCGGDKRSQDRDIRRAREITGQLED